MKEKPGICLALDGMSAPTAYHFVRTFAHRCYAIKTHVLSDSEGPRVIRGLKRAGAKRVFLDYKIHENWLYAAMRVRAFIAMGVDILTVHAEGGIPMMRACVDAAFAANPDAEIWAVPLLTSMGDKEIAREFGPYGGKIPTAAEIFLNRSIMSEVAGAKGVICSAQEPSMLSSRPDFQRMKLVAVGTRPEGVAGGSHVRSGTAAEAVRAGATHLVIGSEVTEAKDPFVAFDAIEAEIDSTFRGMGARAHIVAHDNI